MKIKSNSFTLSEIDEEEVYAEIENTYDMPKNTPIERYNKLDQFKTSPTNSNYQTPPSNCMYRKGKYWNAEFNWVIVPYMSHRSCYLYHRIIIHFTKLANKNLLMYIVRRKFKDALMRNFCFISSVSCIEWKTCLLFTYLCANICVFTRTISVVFVRIFFHFYAESVADCARW